jgi:hypothetical protein
MTAPSFFAEINLIECAENRLEEWSEKSPEVLTGESERLISRLVFGRG